MSQNSTFQGWTVIILWVFFRPLSFKPKSLLFVYLVFSVNQWFATSNCFQSLYQDLNPLCVHWKIAKTASAVSLPTGAALTNTSAEVPTRSPHPLFSSVRQAQYSFSVSRKLGRGRPHWPRKHYQSILPHSQMLTLCSVLFATTYLLNLFIFI